METLTITRQVTVRETLTQKQVLTDTLKAMVAEGPSHFNMSVWGEGVMGIGTDHRARGDFDTFMRLAQEEEGPIPMSCGSTACMAGTAIIALQRRDLLPKNITEKGLSTLMFGDEEAVGGRPFSSMVGDWPTVQREEYLLMRTALGYSPLASEAQQEEIRHHAEWFAAVAMIRHTLANLEEGE